MELDLAFLMQTRQSEKTRPAKKNNPHGDDFVVDRIDLKKIVEELVGHSRRDTSVTRHRRRR